MNWPVFLWKIFGTFEDGWWRCWRSRSQLAKLGIYSFSQLQSRPIQIPGLVNIQKAMVKMDEQWKMAHLLRWFTYKNCEFPVRKLLTRGYPATNFTDLGCKSQPLGPWCKNHTGYQLVVLTNLKNMKVTWDDYSQCIYIYSRYRSY